MYGYIYKTTNLKNNKVYVGQHKGDFDPNYYGSGFILKRALNKEGKHNFKIEIIGYSISKEQQNKLEKKFINECRKILSKQNVYNISAGGNGGKVCEINPMLGKRHSAESVELMRKVRLLNPRICKSNCKCCSCRAKRGETKGVNGPFYGKHYTQTKEAKDKIRIDVLGRKWMNNPESKQLKRIKPNLINHYLKQGWLLGIK